MDGAVVVVKADGYAGTRYIFVLLHHHHQQLLSLVLSTNSGSFFFFCFISLLSLLSVVKPPFTFWAAV